MAKYVVKHSSVTFHEGDDNVVRDKGDVVELDANDKATKRYLELGAIQEESEAKREAEKADHDGDDSVAEQPATGRRARANKE